MCDILRLKELIVITDFTNSVKKLPKQLHRRTSSDKVRFYENKKIIRLTPIKDLDIDIWNSLDELRNIFSDCRMSTQKYTEQKQIDKGLEI